MPKHSPVDDLNHMIHLSMGAARAYNRLLGEKGKVPTCSYQLSQIAMSHQQAVATLCEEIRDLGGEPESGEEAAAVPPLPRRAKAVALVNDDPVLAALQDVERRSIEECARLLRHSLQPEARQFLLARLMPILGEHIDALQDIIDRRGRLQ